ncbi:hypothetical protein AALP_AA2G196300 [Arabis alpina]|uniref:Uncharacterized protein n=1 Tax=Arabis alpina TaxID=50452 RepID=A0A087HIM4_ARAAL|nr:hypothetical protein AALP_AA2G196300 [Arabis alpina]
MHTHLRESQEGTTIDLFPSLKKINLRWKEPPRPNDGYSKQDQIQSLGEIS